MDSPVEGTVLSEPVSEAKFPVTRENTGNFIDSSLGDASEAAKKWHQNSALRANSLRIRTGNFLLPCRELNRAIREIFAVIRESRSRPLFWPFAWVTNPKSRQISKLAEKAKAPPGRREVAPAQGWISLAIGSGSISRSCKTALAAVMNNSS
jgi:hypothetical protein